MKFLVVDAGLALEPMLRTIIDADFPGAQLYSTTDREQALDLVERIHPDVVVLAIPSPSSEGLSLCQSIRQRSESIIMAVISTGSVHDRIEAFEMGADDCVDYPFYLREMSLRIKARLRARCRDVR